MKRYREGCAWAYIARKPLGWVSFDRAVLDVQYRAHRGCGGYHPKDEDNARAALKGAVDALKDARIISSDAKDRLSWRYFELITTEREVSRIGKAGITIIVRCA